MKQVNQSKLSALAVAVGLALSGWQAAAHAQDSEDAQDAASDDDPIEEITVTGRFISSSQQLVNERMNDA